MSSAFVSGFAPPAVFALAQDLAALRALADQAEAAAPGSDLFRREVRRLSIVEAARPDFVRLGDLVRYRDLRTKRERAVRVVRPGEVEPDANAVSVLSPIGAALIGLRAGAVFRWADVDGRPRAVKVLDVEPAGRAGA